MEKTIKIPEGYKFKEVKDGEVVFEKLPLPVTERIKTFEDAVNELGEDNDLVQEYRQFCANIKCFSKDLEAYLKLRIIVAALNEGWEPQFIKYEKRWHPLFWLFTNEEMENMDEAGGATCRVVYRSHYYAYAVGGVSCALAYYDSSFASANIGSRLAFWTKELAEYAGKQFTDLYCNFLKL